MSSFYLFLLLRLSNVALALPASRLALLSPVDAIFPNDSFTSAESAMEGFTSLSNNSNLGDEFLEYRIPDTPLLISFNLKTTDHLVPENLYNTLHKTQTHLRALEVIVPNLINTPLMESDDPFTSLPADSVDAFFGITHWPAGETHMLTYGMVDMVLTGLLDVLFSQGRFCAATFVVKHDVWKLVGIGRVELRKQMLHAER